MNNIKCKKGDIQVLINPITKQTEWQNPSNIFIYIGKVDYNENGQKRVFSGTPMQLGVFLSEKEEEIQHFKEIEADYLKLKDDYLKMQSEYLQLFNKMNNNQEILVNKVVKLENSVTTLLSIQTGTNNN